MSPLLALNGHAAVVAVRPLLGEQRKTFARSEYFRVGPNADMDAMPDATVQPQFLEFRSN